MGSNSTIGYVYILYTAWFGEVAKLAEMRLKTSKCVRTLAWFVLVGWAIYPIDYVYGWWLVKHSFRLGIRKR